MMIRNLFYKNKEQFYLTGIILSFIVLSLIHIDKPGVYYDEILFGNAALGCIDNSFITKSLGHLPIMLMPYIGALKAYIYYPLFKLFSVSAYSIRIPVVIIGAFTLFFTFKYVEFVFGSMTAFITISLLATDPSFIFQNKLDWGPVSIALFLQALALFYFLKGAYSIKYKYFILSIICIALGLFNKLDFIWFINALGLSGLIIYNKEIFSVFKNNVRRVLSAVVIPLIFIFVFLFAAIIMLPAYFRGSIFTSNLLQRLGYDYQAFINVLAGKSAYGFFTGTTLNQGSLLLPILIFTLVIAFTVGLFKRNNIFDRKIVFFIIMLIAILMQILFTKEATGCHHTILTYPFPHIIASYLIVYFIRAFGERRGVFAIALFLVSIIVVSNLLVVSKYISAFANDTTTDFWSAKIYDLIDYTKQNNGKLYICGDWGFNNQLLTFSKGKVRTIELFPMLNNLDLNSNEKEQQWLVSEFISKPESNFIFHRDGGSVFTKAKSNFFGLLKKYHYSAILIKSFKRDGEIYCELYGTTPNSKVLSNTDINMAFDLVKNFEKAKITGRRPMSDNAWGKTVARIEIDGRACIFSHPDSSQSYMIALPKGESLVFKSSVGYHPAAKNWGVSDGVRMTIKVIYGFESKIIFDKYVMPKNKLFNVEIPLDDYSGKNIILKLSSINDPGKNANGDWAVWFEPRIILEK